MKFRFGRATVESPNEHGAALVEGAIIFMPLCMIIFGIIEFGAIFKDNLTLSSATHAGARVASAAPQDPDFISDTVDATQRSAAAAKFSINDTLWIYKAANNGSPMSSCPSSTCVVYRYRGNGTWAHESGAWNPTTHNACLGSTIDKVGVRLSLRHRSITGWFPTIQLQEQTTMRLEPLDANCD